MPSRQEKRKQQKNKRGTIMEEKLMYSIDGNIGRILNVYEDRCVIAVGGRKKLLGGLLGDKQIYYSDVTSVQFKNLGFTSGYLQFEFPGAQNANNYSSENSFVFGATVGTQCYNELKKRMPVVYQYIMQRVHFYKTNTNSSASDPASCADEILKFKQLLDAGVITQEEFDAKRKQLLNL